MRDFRNEFNKFNKAGAQMLDSIYHITLNLLENMKKFCHLLRNAIMGAITLGYLICIIGLLGHCKDGTS